MEQPPHRPRGPGCFQVKGRYLPACSSGNAWGQRDVLHSLLQGTGGGRRLFRAICRAQLVSAPLRFCCWLLPPPDVAANCTGISVRGVFQYCKRQENFYFIALCFRNSAAAVHRTTVAERSTSVKTVLCSDCSPHGF